jgi:hypothetical protein
MDRLSALERQTDELAARIRKLERILIESGIEVQHNRQDHRQHHLQDVDQHLRPWIVRMLGRKNGHRL